MAERKIVLAYSGGLDTSVAIRWLAERHNADIITLTADLGGDTSLENARQRALDIGATHAIIKDLRGAFIEEFIFPTLQAGAVYEGHYPLATALGRPLIARTMVEVAHREGAFAVAHGSTGKGNDQVRFDVSVASLDPSLEIIAPAREWGMSRDDEIEYARVHGIPLNLGPRSLYSIDENLWGRSIEAGDLEDPSKEPPEEAFTWTRAVEETPDTPLYLDIGFDMGIPVSVNEKRTDPLALIQDLNRLAGNHGVGRIDHIENRLVGIKSHEIYEAPAAVVLHTAHRALEYMTLAKEQLRLKERLSQEYADLVYNGLWFTHHRQDIEAYVVSNQRWVTGSVRLRLYKGACIVVGRRSPYALYRHELATYDQGDQFDQPAARGFIAIYGLPVRTQVQIQGQTPLEPPSGN